MLSRDVKILVWAHVTAISLAVSVVAFFVPPIVNFVITHLNANRWPEIWVGTTSFLFFAIPILLTATWMRRKSSIARTSTHHARFLFFSCGLLGFFWLAELFAVLFLFLAAMRARGIL